MPGALAATFLLAAVVTVQQVITAQQVPDTAFSPVVDKPRYQPERGPRVTIDAAHLNFHTADGGYAPFAKLLRQDGYRVESSAVPFATERLGRMDVLVIANAMHKQSEKDWAPLPSLSAFTDAEIAAVEAWVRNGASLLLIADHMPLPVTRKRWPPRLACGFRTASRWMPRTAG